MTLFDTDVIIWMMRGNKIASATINAAPSRAISAVSFMEFLHGAFDSREARAFKKSLEALKFRVLPVSEAISARAVSLMEEHALSVRLDPMDALVFATALDYDIVLCSGNEKHFRPIRGLRAQAFRPR